MGEWYEESFGEDYLIVYRHRDMQGARREVRRMMEWLALPQGAEVLDLCCGMGRHSLALRDLGYKVTGIDLSEVLLREARRRDPQATVQWVRADMRRIPLDREFDAVVNLFTSFGYFEADEENRKVLLEVERLLKPAGKFIIDYLNPSHVKAHLVPRSERQDGDMVIRESREIEGGFVRKSIAIEQAGRPSRTYREQVKLYGLSDFRRLLEGTSLRVDRVYGNYDEASHREDVSPRLILVGRKEGTRSESAHGQT